MQGRIRLAHVEEGALLRMARDHDAIQDTNGDSIKAAHQNDALPYRVSPAQWQGNAISI